MRRRVAIFVLLLAIAATGWWFLSEHVSLDAILEKEAALRHRVQSRPVVATLVGFIAYVLLSLVPGTSGKAIVYGWLFGFWIGLLICCTSLTLAAVVSFLVVRYLLRDVARSRLSAIVNKIDRMLEHDGATYLFTLRLLHAPYTLTNYASGATSVRLRTFTWTTLLGMLPGTVVYVLAGANLPALSTIADDGIWAVLDLRLLMVLSLLGLVPLMGLAIHRLFFANSVVAERNSH
ncbi:MAG: TVP38/TMEM64 family protein [Pirellulaceae bacterium]|nr:TVP38/TMEM64 family protein [Pirellulaceae bacterium]